MLQKWSPASPIVMSMFIAEWIWRSSTTLSRNLAGKQAALCSKSYSDCLKFRTWQVSRQVCVLDHILTVSITESDCYILVWYPPLSLTNILFLYIYVIESRCIRWAKHVASMERKWRICMVLVGEPAERKLLWSPRSK
jgi:hypothetical protein